MIVHGCIEIHPKDCGGLIIVTGFRVLLILHKGFMENYQCWYAYGEVFVSESERRMEETVVGSTSSASNVHEAANDNTNPYRNMVMDAMRMNEGNVSKFPIIEEELNI